MNKSNSSLFSLDDQKLVEKDNPVILKLRAMLPSATPRTYFLSSAIEPDEQKELTISSKDSTKAHAEERELVSAKFLNNKI